MLSTFIRKTSQLARRDGRDVIGRQRNGSAKFHSGKISQVRLTNKTTKNRKFADHIDGKGINDGCRALDGAVEHIRKTSCGRQDLVNWPNQWQSLRKNRSCLNAACDPNFGAWIASVARMMEVEKGSGRVCVLWQIDIPGAVKKERSCGSGSGCAAPMLRRMQM